MAWPPSPDEARLHFAEELRVVSHVGSETLIEAFEAFDVGEDVPPPSDDLAEKIKQANAADAERRERVAVS